MKFMEPKDGLQQEIYYLSNEDIDALMKLHPCNFYFPKEMKRPRIECRPKEAKKIDIKAFKDYLIANCRDQNKKSIWAARLHMSAIKRMQTGKTISFSLLPLDGINNMIEDITTTQKSTPNGEYLPTKEDFELVCQKLKANKEVSIDRVLHEIEIYARESGRSLKPNWKEITEKKIMEIWTKKDEGT